MVVPLKNFSGHFTFMPAHILHWADPNPQDALRISTGYNISTLEEIEKEDKDIIAIRNMMMLSLGFDHRLIDGAGGAKFLLKIKKHLR